MSTSSLNEASHYIHLLATYPSRLPDVAPHCFMISSLLSLDNLLISLGHRLHYCLTTPSLFLHDTITILERPQPDSGNTSIEAHRHKHTDQNAIHATAISTRATSRQQRHDEEPSLHVKSLISTPRPNLFYLPYSYTYIRLRSIDTSSQQFATAV